MSAGRLAVALVLLPAAAPAKVFEEAHVSAPFLKIGQGARAAGMGEAFTAVADDSTAVFWNPAGLAQLSGIEVQFTHNQWVDDFRHEYFGIAVPYAGTWALAYSVLDLGRFARVDAADNPTGDTFEVNDQALQFGYARGFANQALLIGTGVKTVKEDLGEGVRGQTASFDAGLLAVPFWEEPRVAFGAVVENVGGKLSGFPLPATVRLGVSWRKSGILAASTGREANDDLSRLTRYPWELGEGLADSLTLAADVLAPWQGRVELHAGAEYWLSIVAVRAGYRFRYPRNDLGGPSGLTVGLGLRGRGFQFDYGFDASYAPYGDLGNASRFSVIITF